MNQELFYVQNFCAVKNESVWPFFNLSVHMDIPLMYLGLYLNVSVLTLRQPKLSFLCYSCILRLFAIFVKFLNGLFIFMKL